MRCPECGGLSGYSGNDERGAIYTCESSDRRCVVFDHWSDDVRTYRGTSHKEYDEFADAL
jgi:hypothetical protein